MHVCARVCTCVHVCARVCTCVDVCGRVWLLVVLCGWMSESDRREIEQELDGCCCFFI